MIPRIIHLCWFGKGKYPELAEMCINSWKKILPNYKIMIWNENSFDVNSQKYTREAYQQKKWAFVSDYVRLKALEEYGGVYMDTDVEVIRDFSELLFQSDFVSSTLEGGLITAGFIATVAHHPFICELKKMYENDTFLKDNKSFQFTMNPLLFTETAMKMYNFSIGNKPFISQNFTIFTLDYFMPYRKSLFSKDLYAHNNYYLTENTYTIHHDMGSWGKSSKTNWWKRALARQIIPQRIYLRMKEKKYIDYMSKHDKSRK